LRKKWSRGERGIEKRGERGEKGGERGGEGEIA